MTPGARISAAIECLDLIFDGAPAEKVLTGWARRSRFAGSKDRAAVRDHVFDALRRRDSYAAIGGGLNGRSVMIGHVYTLENQPFDLLFDGVGHAPVELSDEEKEGLATKGHSVNEIGTNVSTTFSDGFPGDWSWDMQAWCVSKLEASHPQNARDIADALKSRAPVDLRINTRRATSAEAIESLNSDEIEAGIIEIAPCALRISKNARKIKLSRAYLDGLVELQDAGSQALINTLPTENVEKILDYCAGGGGKSLALAAVSEARIFAHDISEKRMSDIPVRAERAEVAIKCITTDELKRHAPYDMVLCDAPCSGSGSWRRSPDAKWRLTQEEFEELLGLQYKILSEAQAFVSSGGYLAYATCSLFAEENEDQVNQFLKNYPKFERISKSDWTPLDGCDGFYVCVMQLKG